MRRQTESLLLGLLLVAAASGFAFGGGGSTLKLSKDEENRVRSVVEKIDDEEPVGVLKGDEAAQTRFWAPDVTVNAPNNRIMRHSDIVKRMEEHTGLQYSSFERHREATVIRPGCAVTMGYEVVVPKGNVPNSGKTINRRYTNIYYFENGAWYLIARQATNVSVK